MPSYLALLRYDVTGIATDSDIAQILGLNALPLDTLLTKRRAPTLYAFNPTAHTTVLHPRHIGTLLLTLLALTGTYRP